MSIMLKKRDQISPTGVGPDRAGVGPSRQGVLKTWLCTAAVLVLLSLAACSPDNGPSAVPDEVVEDSQEILGPGATRSQGTGLNLAPSQIRTLQALIDQPGASPELAKQAQIILAVAGGMDNDEIARKFGADADEVDLVDLNELLGQLP